MNSFIANLAQELGVPHKGPWTPDILDVAEATTALSRLNGCSEEVASQIVTALKSYSNDPGCNGMFFGAVAATSGATNTGDSVSLGNACFIDLQNPANNTWSFSDISDDISTVYCNGLLVGLIGVAQAGVSLTEYSETVVPNIPHQLFSLMGFTLLLAQGEGGKVDITLGLVDASGTDIEWFEFDTVQTEYIVAKGVFLNNVAFSSLYFRAAMYGGIPIDSVQYTSNDMLAELLIKGIDSDASGVVDITPAVEEPVDEPVYEAPEVIDPATDNSLFGAESAEAVDELGNLESFDTLPEFEPVAGQALDSFDPDSYEPEALEPVVEAFEPIVEPVEPEPVEPEPVVEAFEPIVEPVEPEPVVEAFEPIVEPVEPEPVVEAFEPIVEPVEPEPIAEPVSETLVEEVEALVDEVIEVEPEVVEPVVVSLGRDDLVSVLRRVLGASDSLITLIIGEKHSEPIELDTYVSIDALCHVLTEEAYPVTTIQSFMLLADQYATDGFISCGVAIQVIATAIWGEIPDYAKECNLQHAASILVRHRDSLWLGVYNTVSVIERLTALGYATSVCERVGAYMQQVDAESTYLRKKLVADLLGQ